MNKITLEDRTQKPLIHIPPFGGLGSFGIVYHHNIKQPKKNIIKIELTVQLKLHEVFTGEKSFHIMAMVSKYRVNVLDRLKITDLTKIWFECAANLIEVYNAFEQKKFGKKNEINHSSEEDLIPIVQPVMDWYNSSLQ